MTLDYERVATALAANPDYRVLRRLKPLPPSTTAKAGAATIKVVVLDTESTGLNPEEDKIIDVGLLVLEVDASTGEFVRISQTFECLEDPGAPISGHITALTGITDMMVTGKKIDDKAFESYFRDVALVIAHSANHDRPFLEMRFPFLQHLPWACSLREIDWVAEGRGSSKLEFLAYSIGLFYEGHRALVDCHALSNVLVGAKLHTGETPLQALIAASFTSEHRIFATGAPFEKKDDLRNQGYRWDAEGRVWHLLVQDNRNLERELQWLHAEIYDTRPARIRLERRDARVKFSHREGEDFMMSLGAQGDQTGIENRRSRAGMQGGMLRRP